MTKIINTIILTLIVTVAFSQTPNCNCDGLVNTNFKGKIVLLDKIGGNVTHTARQNFTEESFLIFTIIKDSLNYFLINLSYTLNGKDHSGWTIKHKSLATTLNYYSNPIELYSAPNLESKVKHVIANAPDDYFEILKCTSNWTFIKVIKDKKVYTGWLDPEHQCNNPHTTCN